MSRVPVFVERAHVGLGAFQFVAQPIDGLGHGREHVRSGTGYLEPVRSSGEFRVDLEAAWAVRREEDLEHGTPAEELAEWAGQLMDQLE
jgi:hypothetical protein